MQPHKDRPAAQSAMVGGCQQPRGRRRPGRATTLDAWSAGHPSRFRPVGQPCANKQQPRSHVAGATSMRCWCNTILWFDQQRAHYLSHTHLAIRPHVVKPRPKRFKHKMPRSQLPSTHRIVQRCLFGPRPRPPPAAGFGYGVGMRGRRGRVSRPVAGGQPRGKRTPGPCIGIGLAKQLQVLLVQMSTYNTSTRVGTPSSINASSSSASSRAACMAFACS